MLYFRLVIAVVEQSLRVLDLKTREVKRDKSTQVLELGLVTFKSHGCRLIRKMLAKCTISLN